MKGVIVSGNIDMDHLMCIDGLFKDSILPGRLNNLSVSFQPNKHETSFGGCAANISYTLRLLGVEPYLFSVLGNDYKNFFKWFDSNKISTKYIDVDKTKLSPAAYIMSDKNKNQITFFSSGASMNPNIGMDLKELSSDDTDIMIISPNTSERMLALSRDAVKRGIKYILDPGQACSSLSAEILDEIIFNAHGLIVNDYEYALVLKKTSKSVEDILDSVDFMIKTKGIEGCEIFEKDQVMPISVPAILVVNANPTGCGDAFRAGFIYSYLCGNNMQRACENGTVAASFALESLGTQDHKFTKSEFKERLNEYFPEK